MLKRPTNISSHRGDHRKLERDGTMISEHGGCLRANGSQPSESTQRVSCSSEAPRHEPAPFAYVSPPARRAAVLPKVFEVPPDLRSKISW
jgi:hypothetical protein